jgi:Family of unknown function (DUF6868)
MNIDVMRNAFLWCTLINYVVLIVWFLLYALPHEWLYRLWVKWFRLTPEQFDTINFAGIALYKLGILLFNLVPYVALRILG